MKKSLILLLGAFLFVLSAGCLKEETELKQADNVPSVNIGDNKSNGTNTGNGQVTERAPTCNCTVTAISPTTANVFICGTTTGTDDCGHCDAAEENTGLPLNPSPTSNFGAIAGENFRVNNTGISSIQITVDCTGAPSGGVSFTLGAASYRDFHLTDICDLEDCGD